MYFVQRCILLGWLALPAAGQVMNAPDSDPGDRYSTFDVAAKAGAPFRATVVSSWTYRSTTHWNRHTLFNKRTIARDAAGRVFLERRLYSPAGETKPTTVSEMDFFDPSKGKVLVYDPRSGRCFAQPYVVDQDDHGPLPLTRDIPGGTLARQSLGESVMENLRVEGTRETITAQGKNAPFTIREFWYSPQLALNLSFKRTEWNRDGQTFTVKNVVLGEPDPKLFVPPEECAAVR